MEKIYFGSSFIALIGLMIILVLLMLGKPIPDLIFNIFCGINIICILSSISINRKNRINNKSEKNLKFKKIYIYAYILLFIPIIVMQLLKLL
ncbi:hypothetical protein [Clostridium septicum]|uniref:Uncharacterized protein n=1 Tax=Clostridium septicum TaxID=1504 RepID=A0A9N7PM80_CLOSE|nr:hypothetical protein [Clostridium septicum]AYE34772.1 hypothetical protein CP523_10360 [Clostridium septicum]UEC20581.1 hypothetical protein LK444_14470 [Clostridium septicum]USS01366.1 hypothetical protein NH397_02705 [Clostridium septicum]